MFIFFSSFKHEFKFWLTIRAHVQRASSQFIYDVGCNSEFPIVGQALIVISNIQLYFTLQLFLIH